MQNQWHINLKNKQINIVCQHFFGLKCIYFRVLLHQTNQRRLDIEPYQT